LRPAGTDVLCEACHGPGGTHRDAALKGNATHAKRLIRNPGTLGAAAVNQFCGECRVNLADIDWLALYGRLTWSVSAASKRVPASYRA
jgi:hypothetical protein